MLSGNGLSFCSAGNLAEFGTLTAAASSHVARTSHSPALILDVLGRGWEMTEFWYRLKRCTI